MGDVIIRGVEMPKNCLYCHFVSYDNDHCVVMDKDIPIYGTKPSWCPLVPLPEGHGRLIDADAFCRFVANNSRIDEIIAAGIISYVNAVPTIVQAEGGTDDVRCL